MKNLTRDYKLILTISAVFISLLIYANGVEGKLLPPDRARQLQEHGYPADTPEQIIEATKSESYFVRYIALELLTQRTGDKAIPTLKEALNDERMEVRWRVAHLLGTLGDKSGLERMRQDLNEFAPNNGAPVTPDPNVEDPNEMKEREGKRNLRLSYALRAARVLAELGDCRGYELASRMALDGPWGVQRQKAIHVLVEIARTDPNTLAAEGKDPASVLCAMAESEKNPTVFSTLTSSVQKLGGDIAVQVLERAKNSPHQPWERRRVAEIRLEKVKAEIKAVEDKPETTSKKPCCDQRL